MGSFPSKVPSKLLGFKTVFISPSDSGASTAAVMFSFTGFSLASFSLYLKLKLKLDF